jgi:hypothetical protein
LISTANSLSSHLPPRFVILSSSVLVQAFINVPFTTALLTHGGVLLLLLWYVTPKNALTNSPANREGRSYNRRSQWRGVPWSRIR